MLSQIYGCGFWAYFEGMVDTFSKMRSRKKKLECYYELQSSEVPLDLNAFSIPLFKPTIDPLCYD